MAERGFDYLVHSSMQSQESFSCEVRSSPTFAASGLASDPAGQPCLRCAHAEASALPPPGVFQVHSNNGHDHELGHELQEYNAGERLHFLLRGCQDPIRFYCRSLLVGLL